MIIKKDQSKMNLEAGTKVDGRGYKSEGNWHCKVQSDSMCPIFESLREAA